MSGWIETVKAHPIWQHLENLGPFIDQGFAREKSDPTDLDSLNRLKTVLTFIGKRLEMADPYLLTPRVLDHISANIQSATSEVEAYVSNGASGHLNNANSNVDAALQNIASVHVPTTSADIVAVRKASEEYRVALDKNLRGLQSTIGKSADEFDGLRARLAEVSSELTNEKQRLSSLASDHQAQFSSAQETRSREYQETQSSRQKDFAELFSAFSSKLTEQNAEFSKNREALVRQHDAELSKLTQEYSDAAEIIVQKIEDHKAQVEKLVGVIGNLGVTSGYLKTADKAAHTVVIWQAIALLAFISIIGIAGYAFIPVAQGEFTWERFAGRVFVAISVGALAAYAASQVDKYQQIERRTRKLALELEAIGPYLASLPQEKQEEFRIKVGERSFGTGADMVDRGSLKSPASVPELLLKKEFKDLFVEIIKAAKH